MPDSTPATAATSHRSYKIAFAVAAAVLVACVAGVFLTQGVMDHLPYLHGQSNGWNAAPLLDEIVDQRPWKTARALAELALKEAGQ